MTISKQTGFDLMPEWLGSYRKGWLRLDIIAGLTTAAVVIPKAMAYATIAGLPVEVGLYTAFLPMIIYAVLGSSRVLSVSTTTTLAILAAAELGEVVPNGSPAALLGAAATLTLLVGVILVLASVLRLGFVANFISEPVLVGFKAGIGVVIIVDQVPKILGVHFARGTFFQNFLSTIRSIPESSLPTIAVGVSVILLLLVIEKLNPKAPAPLIAVAGAIAAAYFFKLDKHGVELVGHIPQGLPKFTPPVLSLAAKLWPGAVGIALMSFTESIAAGRAFAASDEPSPRANRELMATGLANAVGSLMGAMPAGGGTSQTAVNRLTGAKTQVSELVTAAIALVTMLFLAPLIGLMPHATLAAVVIVYSVGLIKPLEFQEIFSVRLTEFIWALVAFAGVMMLGTLKGIIVAIIVSLIALAYQVADPPVSVLGRRRGTNFFRPLSEEHPDDETFPGLLLLRIEGRIFFANAAHIGEKTRPLIERYQPKVLAIHLRGVPDLEYTALKMLGEAVKQAHQHGVAVWLVGMNASVLGMVERSRISEILGPNTMLFNLETAVAKYLGEESASVAPHRD